MNAKQQTALQDVLRATAEARRREMIRLLIDEGLTLQEIGERYGGISRERVRQIVREHVVCVKTWQRRDPSDL